MDNNKNKPVKIELLPESSKLYIFFGGLLGRIKGSQFEFYNCTRIIDENKIFIRDFSRCWYHNGLPGISTDIDSTTEYIQNQIEQIKPESIFFVGNSMGGYAAMLFAALIEQGEVIAFAPQTFISPILRLKYGDNRWERVVRATYKKSLFKKKIWDLRKLLLGAKNHLRISIFVSKSDPLDYAHALRIKDVPGIQIYEFDHGGHAIVKLLRDRGYLPTILSGKYTEQSRFNGQTCNLSAIGKT